MKKPDQPKVPEVKNPNVNPKGAQVSNGRSHVEGAASSRDKDEDELDRKNGVESQKIERKP